MKIGIKQNRFHKGMDKWSDEDFWVHLGKNIEIIIPISILIEFRKLETIGSVFIGYNDIQANPVFCDNFVVFKNNEVGRYIYHRFQAEDINYILREERIIPMQYPLGILREHIDVDEKPTIIDKRG